MHRVLVYRRRYLPLSETFIYGQLIGLRRVEPVVLTRKKPCNLRHFPFEPIYVRRNLKGLERWLRRKRIKCLHARFGHAGLDLLPVARRTGLPLITSFHGTDASKYANLPSYRRAYRKLFRHGAAFTAVSLDMKHKLISLGCPEEKITLVRSGINLDKFPLVPPAPVEDGGYRFLSVGRLVEKKGMDVLIRAFRRVSALHPRATLTIVGDGEMRARLKHLIRKWRLNESVTLTGALPHDEVRQHLERCHVFALACKTAEDGNQEGIPNVLMEAMATGRPVISTRHAGIPELVEPHRTGYLAPEGDADLLAEAMLQAIGEEQRWPDLVDAARRRVEEQHDLARQCRILEDLYLRVMGEAGDQLQSGSSPPNPAEVHS